MEALFEVWQEQKERLDQSGLHDEFTKRLYREWSIETGVIEQAYSLDRGTTRILIERGIDAALIPHGASDKDPQLVAGMIQGHYDSLEGMFAFVKGERTLSAGYIKELHAALLGHQDAVWASDPMGRLFEKPLQKGVCKSQPNNPTRPDSTVHEYCPPEHVASEMDRLLALHQEHVARGVPAEVQAAWLHHAFAQIHPFEDGNGRVGRAIASLVFLKSGWFPVLVTRDDRVRYIDALETADQGDLRPFVSLLVRDQRRSVLKAANMANEIRPKGVPESRAPGSLEEVIAATREQLVAAGHAFPKEWLAAKDTAQALLPIAAQRLQEVAVKLREEIGAVTTGFGFGTGSGGPGYQAEITEIAQELDYTPNAQELNQFVQLHLDAARQSKIVFSFHSIGALYCGVLAVSAFLLTTGEKAVAIADDIFQINYKEPQAAVQKRFQPWIDRCVVNGIREWQKKL